MCSIHWSNPTDFLLSTQSFSQHLSHCLPKTSTLRPYFWFVIYYMWEKNRSRFSFSALFQIVQCPPVPSISLKIRFHFSLWLNNTPLNAYTICLYLVIFWWAPKLIPYLSHCEHCFNEHECMLLVKILIFIFLLVYTLWMYGHSCVGPYRDQKNVSNLLEPELLKVESH